MAVKRGRVSIKRTRVAVEMGSNVLDPRGVKRRTSNAAPHFEVLPRQVPRLLLPPSATTSSSIRTPPSAASSPTSSSRSRSHLLRPQRREQRLDEVDARLDREHLPHGDVRRVPQERVVRARLRERAPHVVALEAERVPEAVRIERARDPARHGSSSDERRDPRLAQDRGRPAGATRRGAARTACRPDRRAQPLLHRLDARDELRERARRRAASPSPTCA